MMIHYGALAVLLLATWVAARADQDITAARGLESSITVPANMGTLRARPVQAPSSALLVRVSHDPNGSPQRILFIGLVPGRYDLRDYVERADGRPAEHLPSMPVRVVSLLDPGNAGALQSTKLPDPHLRTGYALAMTFLGVAWLAVPLIVAARRYWPRRLNDAVQPPEERPCRPLDEARLLLKKGCHAALDTDELARLELQFLRVLAQHPDVRQALPPEDRAGQIRALRVHPRTRDVLLALESWLHAGSQQDVAVAPTDALFRWLDDLATTDTTSVNETPSPTAQG